MLLECIIKELYYNFLESGKSGKSEDFGLAMYWQGFEDAIKILKEITCMEGGQL
jgi:hypothetical protein